MPNIVHRLAIPNTSKEKVYQSVATIEGLASWWTTKVSGSSNEGGIIEFRFNEGGPDFKVVKLDKNKAVEWKCVVGPEEWIDTHIEFKISQEKEETILMFKHSGWREEIEFMHHCSTQWAYFLIALRHALAGVRKAQPFGSAEFESISSWTK